MTDNVPLSIDVSNSVVPSTGANDSVILKALNDAKSFLRGELSKRIDIRHTPELTFIYDDSIAYGSRIDEVLEKLEDEKNELSDTSK